VNNSRDERKKFSEIMVGLAENVSAEITNVGLEMRFKALSRYSIEQIEIAAMKILSTWKFTGRMPTIAEFIENIDGKLSDVAEVEAGKVLVAVKHHGGMQSVVFDCATTQAVIVMGFGGWVKMCSELKASDEKWFLKDFVRIYTAYANHRVTHYGHLSGRIEMENSASGILENIPEPIPVGNCEKAKLVAGGNNPKLTGTNNMEISNRNVLQLAEIVSEKFKFEERLYVKKA